MYKSERFNSISHLFGAALALAGLGVLIAIASVKGDAWKIVSFSVYGATLVLLYTFSTLYHSFRGPAKRLFQKLDHAAIYLLIAGTYTPFTLVTLRGAPGWTMFGIIWTLAVIGLLQDLLFKKRNEILSVSIYAFMGWLALAVIRPLARALPGFALACLLIGGVAYSVGILFYALGARLKHGHAIFHVLVLAGSIFHYVTVLYYVA